MQRLTITVAMAAAVAVSTVALTGCSALLPEVYGPERDADGQVVKATDAAATFLRPNDCFRFTTDGDLSRVTIVPCSESHDWVVLAQGDLTLREQKQTDIQITVSAKCAEPFAAFAAAAPAGSAPWQQFLLEEVKRDDRTVTVYSCVATVTVAEP